MIKGRAGLSLAETVVGLFLLSFGVIIATRLFDAGLQHQASIERRGLATKLAEKRMAQLRVWVRRQTTGSGRNFDQANWSAGVQPPTDPDYPGLEVRLFSKKKTIYSPCTEFEKPYVATNEARSMGNSTRSVKVTVSDTSNPRFSVELVSFISDPARPFARVQATFDGPGSSVPAEFEKAGDLANPAPQSWVRFKATGYYPDNREVPDLMFDWYTVPLGGNGTVIPARDGRTARFINGIILENNQPPISTSGTVALVAHGQYHGQGQSPQEWVSDGNASNSPYISVVLPFVLK